VTLDPPIQASLTAGARHRRIINPKTAASQFRGAVVMALPITPDKILTTLPATGTVEDVEGSSRA
jgi:hypothetical protein